MTVEENIWSVLEITEPNESKRLEMLEELLNEFSIQHIRQSPALALSGGERRRAEIARALATQPRLLLLDEPASFLDVRHQVGIYDIVRRMVADEDCGVLTVMHDLNLAARCDRLVLMDAGRVAAQGTPHEVLRRELREQYWQGRDRRVS